MDFEGSGTGGGDRSTAWGEWLYRLALRAYPADFRRRYEDDMLRYFRARRAAFTTGAARCGRARLALEMIRDLLLSVPRQHLTRRTDRPPGDSARRRAADSHPGAAGTGGRDRRPLLESTCADVRAAVRSLRREPGFALTVVLTLALGIGASTAVYSIADGVLLEALPYTDPDRLVYITLQNERFPRLGMSVVDYLAIHERQDGAFEAVAGLIHSRQAHAGGPPLPNRVAVTGGNEPESVSAAWVAGRLFTVLGIEMAAGRDFLAGEDQPGADPVVVISHAFAERVFAPLSRGSAIGRQVFIEGNSFTVVGVLPRGMREIAGVRADAWPQLHLHPPGRRGPFYLRVFGRLAPGVAAERAAAELGRISDEIFPLWASGFQDRTARMVAMPLRDVIIGDVGPVLLIVSGAVALVLLITVANVAGLTLARAVGRQCELAVRAALGAGFGRLTRFVLVENLVLAAAGGLLGTGFGVAGIEGFRRLGPSLPRLDQVGPDTGVLAFVVVVTLACGVLIGLSPLALVLPGGPGRSLRAAGRSTTSSGATQRLRGALVFVEFALTVPLLVAAALLLVSLFNLQAADPGFAARDALSVAIGLPEARYPNRAAAQRFWDQAALAVRDVPGVVAAGLATGLPPDQPAHFNNFDLIDKPVGEGAAQPLAPWSTVSPGFFDALAIPLLEGRTFGDSDDENSAPVAVVTRAWAERFYPGESAVGKQMIAGGCVPCGPTTVVGVVNSVKYRGLGGDGEGVYVPVAQESPRNMYLVVHGERPAAELAPLLRTALQQLDPDLPFEAVSMDERLSASVAGPRHWTVLLGGFGLAAVILAAVGIFGLLSYVVDRQRRDIGVRMALGADGRSIVTLVIRRGLVLAALSVASGLAASFALARWLESMLYEVSATDPVTWAAVAALLLAVAFVACWLPARRAAGIAPSRALAAE